MKAKWVDLSVEVTWCKISVALTILAIGGILSAMAGSQQLSKKRPKRGKFASCESSVLIQRKDDLVRLVRTTVWTISHGRNKALWTEDSRLSANRVLIHWLIDSDP